MREPQELIKREKFLSVVRLSGSAAWVLGHASYNPGPKCQDTSEMRSSLIRAVCKVSVLTLGTERWCSRGR